MAYLRTLREVCEWSDEERPSKVSPRRGLPESPGGFNNDETDSGPAFDCVGSDFGTVGSSPNGTDADRIHICKPVPNPTGELGGVLRGQREDGRSDRGEDDGRRDHPKLVHL